MTTKSQKTEIFNKIVKSKNNFAFHQLFVLSKVLRKCNIYD